MLPQRSRLATLRSCSPAGAPVKRPGPLNLPRFPISFGDGQVALAVRPSPGADLAGALRGMGLTTGVPTIALVSAGAGRAQLDRLGALIEKVLIPVAVATGAVMVDEGHRGGMGARVGEACRRRKAQFPLVGVAPEHRATTGDGLDSNHSHFVVVPADRPGWAATWTSSVTSALAGGNQSVAVVTAGGEPAWESVAEHARVGRVVMVVARTGGMADHLAAALAGRAANLRGADRRAAALAESGQLRVIDPARGAARLAEALRDALTPSHRQGPPKALSPGRQSR